MTTPEFFPDNLDDFPVDGVATTTPDGEIDFSYAYTPDEGESKEYPLSIRVSNATLRRMDELQSELMRKGHPFKTRSDLHRFIINWAIATIVKMEDIDLPSLQTDVNRMRLAGERARRAEARRVVKSTVGDLITEVQQLASPMHREYDEAKRTVVGFLTDTCMAGGEPGVSVGNRMFIREAYGNQAFIQLLGRLRQHVDTSGIIDNLEQLYRDELAPPTAS